MFSFKSFVLVIVFAYVGLGFAETTIKVNGQLQCCSDGLVFLLGNITENSPFKPGSPSNQFIMPADKGKFSVSYTSQRGCYYLANQKVELFERDAISQDDFLNSTMTTFEGNFYLTGSESWDSDVQFYLKASHNCLLSQEQVDQHCQRISIFNIDKTFNDGEFGFQWFIGEPNADELKCPKN
uniref:Uncharacterized protein n=1 Tax=Acrobeloides nanus TaxID=290746 RepID=A0A914EN75_9BILA